MTLEQLDNTAPQSRSVDFLADVAPALGLSAEDITANDIDSHYQALISRAEQLLSAMKILPSLVPPA